MFARQKSSSLEQMVRSQIEARGITDPRVLAAMREVDRAAFVPEALRSRAYDDCPLPIGCEQTISQPYIVALMTAELELTGSERVLEIGTGSGYQTALLARLAGQVYTVEFVAELGEQALQLFKEAHIDNVRQKTGDGTLGWPEEAPFDRILATAASPEVPPPLAEQLADPGVAVLPVGHRGAQNLVKLRKQDGRITRHQFCSCVFVSMRGRYGF